MLSYAFHGQNFDFELCCACLCAVGDYYAGVSVCEATLYTHNLLRANHRDTPPLQYDDQLATRAEQWAMHLAENVGGLVHSSSSFRQGAGENLAYQGAGGIDVYYGITDAAYAWLVHRLKMCLSEV